MDTADHFWLEVSVYADREAAETVSSVFASYAYGGGVAIDEDIAPSPDGGFDYNLDRPVLVKAYLADDDQAGQSIESLRSALDHLSSCVPLRLSMCAVWPRKIGPMPGKSITTSCT